MPRPGQRPAGTGRRRQIVDEPAGEPLRPCPGDHGGIVGAEIERRQDQGEALLGGDFGERRAQALIGGNPAGDDERRCASFPSASA